MEASMEVAPSPWHDRWVFVTGCTGFLGGAVTRELLARGARVVGLVRDRARAAEFAREIGAGQVKIVQGCVEDTARLHSTMVVHEVSAVFHLADSDQGLGSVMRAAGLYHSHVPVVAARPSSQFRAVEEGSISFGPLGIARFGEVFGPRERTLTQAVPQCILAQLANERPRAVNGRRRDFVFVRDAARACLLLAEAVHQAGHALDCTFRSGWELTESAIAEMISSLLESPESRPVELSNPLNWRPETSLSDALRETIEWYRQSNPSKTVTPMRKAA